MTADFTVSVDFTGIVENEPEEVSEYTYGAPEFVPGPVLPEVVEPPVSRAPGAIGGPGVLAVEDRQQVGNAVQPRRAGPTEIERVGVHRRRAA